jgi:hypothetical protein|tara:strand:+ start:714 stop:1034 length:321 start_codon:yes stop_codon:yes gene_type:complete
MTTMFIVLITAIITLSIALGLSVWYIRGLVEIMYQTTKDVQLMEDKMVEFSKHLDNVYEMEMYYGDETLSQLIRHSKEVIDSINRFKNLFEEKNDTTNEEKETEEN